MNALEKLVDGLLVRILENKIIWAVAAGFFLGMYFFASETQARYAVGKAGAVVAGIAGLGVLGFAIRSARDAFHGIDEAATARGEKPSRIAGYIYALMVFLFSLWLLGYAVGGLILN